MKNFIGKPLNLIVEHCENNKINYIISENSFAKENVGEFYVTNIKQKENLIEIIVSKFKIEV